jgi:TolB-like protein
MSLLMQAPRSVGRACGAALLVLGPVTGLAAARAAVAQSTVPVAVVNFSVYTAGATQQAPSDTANAAVATGVIRTRLSGVIGPRLVDSARTAAAAATPEAVAAAGDKPCNVIVACVRAVGRAVGARWVVMGRVSKTSELIWLLSGDLVDVETGALLLDDTTELKGDPAVMIPAGVKLFADRVAKRVSAPDSASRPAP